MAEEEKNREGRPLAFDTVEELQAAVDRYFEECLPHPSRRRIYVTDKKTQRQKLVWEKFVTDPRPMTLSGLAVHLGVNRQTVLNYRGRPEFFGTITRAKEICESWWEEYMANGKNPNGGVFVLKNNYGWVDKSELAVNKTDTEVLDSLEEAERQRKLAVEEAQREMEEDARSEAQ